MRCQKIAVPSCEPYIKNSIIYNHFGTCPFLTIIQLDGCNILSIRSMQNQHIACGKCIELIDCLAEQGIDCIITKKIGAYPLRLLRSLNIGALYSGDMSSINILLRSFCRDKLIDFPFPLACNMKCDACL